MSAAFDLAKDKDRDPFARQSFSQLGEDILVCHILDHWLGRSASGFYVDVGAHHPRDLSNSAILHDRGWSGINIDADPTIIETFQRERPDAVNLAAGVGLRHGVETFYRFDGGAVSTFSEAIRNELLERGNRLVETRDVVVSPLAELLAPHMPSDRTIDYLNIDVEGRDLDAVRTYDFGRFPPSIITIEDHAMNLHQVSDSAIFRLLSGQGYRLQAHSLITSLYMRS